MAASERYNVLVANEYTDKNDKPVTQFSEVGVAFPGKNDSMSVIINPGISVNGRFLICKPKPKKEAGSESDSENDGNREGTSSPRQRNG